MLVTELRPLHGQRAGRIFVTGPTTGEVYSLRDPAHSERECHVDPGPPAPFGAAYHPGYRAPGCSRARVALADRHRLRRPLA